MPLPDNTRPPDPRHDAATAFNARRPLVSTPATARPPAVPYQAAKIFLVVCITAVPFILVGKEIFWVAVLVGFFASVAAFAFSLAAWRRNTRTPRDSSRRIPPDRCRRMFAMAAGLLLFNGWSCVQCDERHRDLDRSIGTMSNLCGIGQAVVQYRDRHNAAPMSLDDLLESGLIYDKQLLLPTDPDGWKHFGTKMFVPSIVYVPEAAAPNANPRAILAYERGPWSSVRMALVPEYQHAVIYADGSVARLTPAELAADLAHTNAPTSMPAGLSAEGFNLTP